MVKKLGNLIDYKETVLFPKHNNCSDKGTTETDVPYQLKAVIVHEGTKISSGHYVCYFQRGSDATIRQSSVLEATSQEAYLLFYETNDADEVQEVRQVFAMSVNLKVKNNGQPQMPLKSQKGKMFPIKYCIPPGYYTLKAGKPGIFKTVLEMKYRDIIPWAGHLSVKRKELPWLGLKFQGILELKHGIKLM